MNNERNFQNIDAGGDDIICTDHKNAIMNELEHSCIITVTVRKYGQ